MKRILINDLGFLKGNNKVPIISKVKYWQAQGYSIAFLCTKDAMEHYSIFLKNIQYFTISKASNPTNRLVLIFEFLRRNIYGFFIIKKEITKFDVFYSLSAVLDLLLIPYYFKLRGSKFKWCVVFDNTVSFKRPGDALIGLLAYTFFEFSLFFLKKADYIYTVTEDLKDYLKGRGFEYKKLVVTGNAVEVDLIKTSFPDPSLKIDALFIGRINETKGIYDLLEVLVLVKNVYPDFVLALMGRGDENSESKFKKKVWELGLQKNITLLGFKYGEEKFQYIKSSRMFLFLSPSESYGVALLEAVCSGLPALVYKMEIYKKLYKNDEVFMFEKGDYLAIAEKVINIMNTKSFKNKAGEALVEKYNWESLACLEMETF